jgi:hypothetical protein
MRHDVVIAESRHNGYGEVVRAMAVIILPEDFGEFGYHVLVLLYDLLLCPGDFFIIVMSRRVACPYNKVYVILDVVIDPLECLVDEGERRVAAGSFCAVDTGRSSFAMACCVRCGA